MSLVAPLLGLLMVAQAQGGIAYEFRADETLTLAGGTEVAIFRSVAGDAVSIRLSFLLQEDRSEAGAGQFIQVQAEERMRSLARRIGARAEVHRTPQGLVYQISGAVADLDFLAWILREGIQPPSGEDFEAARRLIQVENDRRSETPQGVLVTRMRAALAPSTPSVYGTVGSLSRIDPTRVLAVWQRSHRRDNARLVLAGRVRMELALAVANDLRIPEGPSSPAPPPGEETGSPQPDPELIRHWVAEGYPLQRGDEAPALVAGRWLADYARTSGADFEAGVEIWDVGGGRALVVTAAAYPRGRQSMLSRLDTLFEDAAQMITEDEVEQLSGELRTEIIMAGRTPWGLAELVGQAWDAGNGPEGVASLVSELETIEHGSVVALLDTLGQSTPIREELRP